MSFLAPVNGGLDSLNRRAALGAGLDDFVVLAGDLHGPPAFAHIVRNGLLHINVLAGLDRPNRGQRMPVVRSGNGNGVHVFAFEQFADVRVAFQFAQLFDPASEHIGIRITEGGNTSAVNFGQAVDVIAPASVEPHHGDADVAVGTG